MEHFEPELRNRHQIHHYIPLTLDQTIAWIVNSAVMFLVFRKLKEVKRTNAFFIIKRFAWSRHKSALFAFQSTIVSDVCHISDTHLSTRYDKRSADDFPFWILFQVTFSRVRFLFVFSNIDFQWFNLLLNVFDTFWIIQCSNCPGNLSNSFLCCFQAVCRKC